MRGILLHKTCSLLCGSSPHVRGILTDVHRNVVIERFIPACAGHTPAFYSNRPGSPVHPRMCGEYIRTQAVCGWAGGSSRMCGAYLIAAEGTLRGNGSSRMCGNRQSCRVLAPTVHPAYAGTFPSLSMHRTGSSRMCGLTRLGLDPRIWRPVHPRVCGTYRDGDTILARYPGSSRVCGKYF